MSTPITESAGVTKPVKDTAESLTEKLWAKADAELKAIIDRHINLDGIESDVISFQNSGWKHVNLRIDGLSIEGEVWAPTLIEASKEATFAALRDYYRNRYVANFIHRVMTMQEDPAGLQE